MKTLFIFLLLLFTGSESATAIKIGDASVKLVYTNNNSTVATIVSLHNSETIAVDAAKGILPKSKFNILQLQNAGNRNIKFSVDKQSYEIDPNRVFTDSGVALTLKERNKTQKSFPIAVTKEVKRFGEELLSEIKKRKMTGYIVAAHNNYKGFENEGAVSILNYANFKTEANKDVEDVAIFDKNDLDDFVLVTQRKDFDFFKSKRVNVALYKKEVKDDGSLSVYCIQNNIPYINIEAQHDGKTGHIEEQKKLMELTFELLTK